MLLLLLLPHSPSPSPLLPSPSPSPSPLSVQLALLSALPAGYEGPGANVTAVGANGGCAKTPAPQLSEDVTAQQPGDGVCGGDDVLAPGTYNLTQEAPPGTTFLRWDLYNATDGTFLDSLSDPVISLQLDDAVTVVAVFSSPDLPSPSPALSPR